MVYAVAFSYNGQHFASGSQDKTVIIWNEKHQGLLKYLLTYLYYFYKIIFKILVFRHNESLQCLAFSPITDLLLSCAIEDFGKIIALFRLIKMFLKKKHF